MVRDITHETTDAPTQAVGGYLRKRHTSEGPKRRCIARSTLDPALASLSDAELDDRNARIWAVVQESCQVALGLDVVTSPDIRHNHGIRGLLYCTAQKAALRICRKRYGIPPARLAGVCSHERGWISHVTRASNPPNADVAGLIARWESSGGPSRVVGVEDHVTVQISASAAVLLAQLVGDTGDPVSFLSELVFAAG